MRNRNPYQGIDWEHQLRVTGCTHLHCSTREEFVQAVDSGLEFATFSNYRPSAPYYPYQSIRQNSFKLHQDGYVQNGKYNPERIDYRQKFAEWGEDCSAFPTDEGERIFPDAPEGFLEAPNAEHHFFSDCTNYLHITAPGSRFASGTFYHNRNAVLKSHGIKMGASMPWRDAVKNMIDNLIVPDGGGVIINHPQWSHLPHDFLCEVLDYDDRVLGLEVVNTGCRTEYSSGGESQWDAILATGRQCFGFCTQDHLSAGLGLLGRSILLPEERTVESCLKAYRQGRFYGAIKGQGLTFESISFDGSTIRVRCDKEAIMLLISRQGVVLELWPGQELVYTVKDEERSKHVFFRVTALDQKSGEKLYTQPVMLI